MPSIEIYHVDGTMQERELSRRQPLSIGRQTFNDICVPEEDVSAMHCRILWNKSAFEVAAANPGGVEVNGTSVTHARLTPGDVIRVGSLDLIYVERAADENADMGEPEIKLREEPPPLPRYNKEPRPEIDSDLPPRLEEIDEPGQKARGERGKRSSKPDKPVSKPIEDLSLFEGPVNTPSQVLAAFGKEELSDEDEFTSTLSLKPIPGGRSSAASSTTSPAEKPAAKDRTPILSLASRARPGEQDIFQSPLVLGLSIGGAVLLLVAGIFWFLIAREQATRLYDRALAELNGGQYAQAITSFEQFLTTYSGHSLQIQAERGLSRAQVQKEIGGATPAWKRGLEQLQALISSQRNQPDFKDLHPTIHKFAEEIALGAARGAEATRDAELLTVSEDAQVLLERFADPTLPPTAAISRIKEARVAAVIAVSKQKFFDDSMAVIDQAIADGKPMVALSERERLVRSFDGFASQKRVKDALQKALDLERSVVVTDEVESAAETTDVPPPTSPSVLGVFHTRIRTDEPSQGRAAFALGKDCCYAIDTVTGELVWRRVIGFNPPFFPKTVSGRQPGLLMFDALIQSLVCCRPATGELIWRHKLSARPLSAPLVHEGQIYIATSDRGLCRLDLDSGRQTERVTFSQNVVGPPVLSHDGNHLLIPGEAAMIYSLSMRPLAAAATTFTDHAAGSITAPPLSLGRLLLLCENDHADSSLLRVWDAGKPKSPLVELAAKSIRVGGQVRQTPVLRGNQLIVPSSGEQLGAFSVTDEPGREGLVPIAQYRISVDETVGDRPADNQPGENAAPEKGRPNPLKVPMYVALGADKLFWVASSAFRRFDIGPDAIHIHSNFLAVGIASQELQLAGDQFFIGRKAMFHDAVTFSAVDRDRMISPWRIVLGAKYLELGTARDGGALGLTEAGHLVMIGLNRLRQGGFDLKAASELELPAGIKQPLVASTLHSGQIFLAAQSDVSQLWIINPAGQIEFTTRLAGSDEIKVPAVLLDGGLVVPLAGRLKFVSTAAGKKPVQDWLAPAGEQPAQDWRFLVRLDSDELIACDAGGLLTRIQLRTEGVPHLAGVAKLQLGQPVDLPPASRDDAMLIADGAGNVQQLNVRTFDRDGAREFKSPVRGVWSIGNTWLVWSGDDKLHSMTGGNDLPIRWSFDLNGLKPAGPPLEAGNRIWIACRDGHVLVLDSTTGAETVRTLVPQSLTMGLKKFDDGLYAVACDGMVYRIDVNPDK